MQKQEMNIMRMKTTTALAAALALAATLAAPAAEVIKPNIGEPLRDAAVTRAPDGTYYMTGTRCMNKRYVYDEQTKKEKWTPPEKILTPEGKPDFMSNDGVKLWSSKDLVNWKDEGLAYDLTQRGKWHDNLSHLYALPDRPLGAPPVRGAVAPRLQVVGGKCIITLSNVGQDVRWLVSGKPMGPYEDGWSSGLPKYEEPYMRTRGPGHGSIFTDTDGTSYLIRGPGYLEKLKPDLKDKVLSEARFLLAEVAGYPNADWCAKQFNPCAASIALINGKYILTWAASTDESEAKRDDSFYAVAGKLTGPYSEARPFIKGSGPVVLFATADQGVMASCSIGDAPVLVPVKFESGTLSALAQPELPAVPKAAKAGKPQMFDYANAKPSGKWSERAGEELNYTLIPAFADKPGTPEPRKGRNRLMPLFDLPMQDVSVCKGGDDAWYLAGTVASKVSGVSVQAGKVSGVSVQVSGGAVPETRNPKPETSVPKPDFCNNDGIYLWRSTDLDIWIPLGKVWDIEKDGSAWAKQYRIPGDNPLRDDFCRGVTAPEIHFIKGTYYLAYSMNGRGTGLLKSTSGKAEGPYEDAGRVTAIGETPSIFDDNGSIHWLFGKGLQMAPIDLARGTLTGAVTDVLPRLDICANSNWNVGMSYWDVTGPHLFAYFDNDSKARRYALSFSAVTQVYERANRDTLMAVSDSRDGIFRSGMRMIPHGGQTTVFTGSKGEFCATFSGADPSAVFRDRPSIVPMEAFQAKGSMKETIFWPRLVHGDYYTERGPWCELLPPKGGPGMVRDPEIFNSPDGHYYYSASGHGTPTWEGGIRYWRTKEVDGPWEDIGLLYTMEQMRDDPKWPAIDDGYQHWNNAKFAWEPWMGYGKGTHWLSIWFGGKGWGKDVCWKKSIGALLKSESGKAEGPYKLHWVAFTPNLQGLLFDDDGSVYGFADGPLWKMNENLDGIDLSWTERDGITLPELMGQKGVKGFRFMSNGRLMTEDCNLLFFKIDGRYIARGLGGNSSYDGIFAWADDIRGPYHYMGVLPILGNSPIIKDARGAWRAVPQGGIAEAFTTPFRDSNKARNGDTFLYEVALDAKSDKPSIWPTHDLGHLDEAVYRK
jgi:hypothetical protein